MRATVRDAKAKLQRIDAARATVETSWENQLEQTHDTTTWSYNKWSKFEKQLKKYQILDKQNISWTKQVGRSQWSSPAVRHEVSVLFGTSDAARDRVTRSCIDSGQTGFGGFKGR